VVVYNGPNCYNDEQGIRGPQTGIYKWPWMYGPTDVTERVIYLDEFAVGGEKSTYADVAPSTMVKADFGISAKDCSAEVSFVNTSSSKLGQIDSCLWDFGDGTTSRETSPVHVYASPGKYYVTLTAYDSTFTSTEKDSMEVYFAPKPSDVSAKQNDDGTVTLTASGTGTINWYDVLSGGEIIGTGDTFTTSVTNTEVFYAENVIGGNTVSRGAKAGKGDTGDYYKWEDDMAVWGLEFDTETEIVLKSVKVYNGESESGSYTGPRTFTVVTSSGDTVAQTTVDVTEGEQRLELNMTVPPGKGYRLFPDRHMGLWRDTDGAVFPYAVGPAVMITAGLRFDGLKPADRQGYYYFFYDWEVEAEMPVCHSARVGTDGTVGMKKTKDTAITLFPNPADDHLQIKGLPAPAKGSVQIYNSLCQLVKSADMRGDTQMEVNTGDLPPGMYFCRVVADGRLLCTKKVMIVR
jgi:PKD repeat protein